MACCSYAISVIPRSEFEERAQILNTQSCLLYPSRCPRNASIAFLPLKNCPEILDRLFWFGKMCGFQPDPRPQRQMISPSCSIPIPHCPLSGSSICQYGGFAQAPFWAGEGGRPLRNAWPGVLCASCCMERRDCQVKS